MDIASTQFGSAMDSLAPDRFGFSVFEEGWVRDFPGHPRVAFASIAWPHNQAPSYEQQSTEKTATNALKLLVSLQQQTWGFPPEETVPVNVLSTLHDTGGAVLIAYDIDQGFNSDGWLGFAIGFGARTGEYYSHMLGVREDIRGCIDLGWYLKVLQAYLAVDTGHHAMFWTFDPMRGANARLNLEKLSSEMVNLTIDKYGVMESKLYGNVPTDRFTAWWNLFDPDMHQRLRAVTDKQFHPLSLVDIAKLPVLNTSNYESMLREEWPTAVYEIPGDIDQLAREDPDLAIRWRFQMREILGALMTSRQSECNSNMEYAGPISVRAAIKPGPYVISRFASGIDTSSGMRRNYYVLTRKEAS